jgi:hypothetical protein
VTPFSVRQVNSDRGFTNVLASWVSYVELSAYGSVYRLSEKKVFTKNGNERPYPYMDSNNVQVFLQGRKLVLTTTFGLSIDYDGDGLMNIVLCDAYRPYICGMCGNADGNNTNANEFVDRFNRPTALDDKAGLMKYYEWSKYWKVNTGDHNAVDLDKKSCYEEPPTECPNTPGPSYYKQSNEWCGLMKNATGPWAQCLQVN